MLAALNRPLAKRVGALILYGIVCLAIGNVFATKDALDGSARWWQHRCHVQLKQHEAYDQWRGLSND